MGPVEKFNPLKASALSRKRDGQKAGKWGKKVAIREITLAEVRADAIQFGLATDVPNQIKAGKEASIFLAYWKEFPLLLKAYRFWQTAHGRRKRNIYAPAMMEALAAKEFDVLSLCFKHGMNVPTPVGRVGNYLTMRLIGDGPVPAPQLRTVKLEQAELVLDAILNQYLVMYRDCHYVHGDLSEYNILWWDNRPWIIDMPQAYKVDAYCDMMKVEALLRRDIENVLQYFKQYDIERDPEEILNVFLSEYVPKNLRNYREFAVEGDLV